MGRKIIVILLGVIFLITIFQIFFRYKVVKTETKSGHFSTEHFYRYDRLTGNLSKLVVRSERQNSTEKAIELVKNLRSEEGIVSFEIQNHLSKIEGDVDFKGWEVKTKDNNKYLVNCAFVEAGKVQGWWWEVDFDMDVARPIIAPWMPKTPIDLLISSIESEKMDTVMVFVLNGRKLADFTDADSLFFRGIVQAIRRRAIQTYGVPPLEIVDKELAEKYGLADSANPARVNIPRTDTKKK